MLQVPNQFHYEWLDSKYHNLINTAVKECAGKELKINYSVVISDQEENIIPDLILEKKQSVDSSDQFENMINSFIDIIRSDDDLKFNLLSHHLNMYNVRSSILKDIYNKL